MTEAEFREIIKSSLRDSLQEIIIPQYNCLEKPLSLKEASSFLNLATQTIYGYTSQRTIPFYKKGKKLLFLRKDLEAWVLEGRQRTRKEIERNVKI
jgi:excisionase family DNA binding protein